MDGALLLRLPDGIQELHLFNYHSHTFHGCESGCSKPQPKLNEKKNQTLSKDNQIRTIIKHFQEIIDTTHTRFVISYSTANDCPEHRGVQRKHPDDSLMENPSVLQKNGIN